ncbi:hypothetical protein PV405_15255 [Streptomyces sp. ME02-6979-3A]|uniref:hypothetical protein n=1 Tax=unclassified Streptomyces TaxID=2593676 RepID=UPI0029BD44E0|nr:MULTISPECIES: hypothetical protein [unclassified Streptomyces]MDX3326010.1 hypothetical protein [Streptomyces sp. ME02-6979-3A]MDX3688209.1 hypothetical protein [Streptomyces sp. AK04-4c]
MTDGIPRWRKPQFWAGVLTFIFAGSRIAKGALIDGNTVWQVVGVVFLIGCAYLIGYAVGTRSATRTGAKTASDADISI